MSEKQKIADALEQVRCAQVNLENLGNQSPALKAHPFFKIVEVQLGEAERTLSDE